MVKWLILFLSVLVPIWADVEVTTQIDSTGISENSPIQVLVKVSREEGQLVDEGSFQLDGDPLEVELVNTARQASLTIINDHRSESVYEISTYRFFLAGRPQGTYLVPEVSVEVEGKRYVAKAVSFEILSATESDAFRLQAFIDGVTPLYPGQKARFVYRIFYQGAIEVTYEDLPLMEAEGFKRLGDRAFRSFARGKMRVREIAQEVEALEPGDFEFGPSVIEGYAYQESFFGRKRYIQPRLRAEAEVISLRVAPFPTKDKPPSFNGAIGRFEVSASKGSQEDFRVGDKIELVLRFTGPGELDTIRLPSFATLPGFRGKFRFSDLPPVAQKEEGAKVFVVELRPLDIGVKEIPELEFAYFDPVSRKYNTVRTERIPIHVSAAPKLEEFRPDQSVVEEKASQPEEQSESPREEWGQVEAIEIMGNYNIEASDLRRPLPWWMQPVPLLIVAVLAYALQLLVRSYRRSLGESLKVPESERLIQLAERVVGDRQRCLQVLEEALSHRLVETHGFSGVPVSPEALPEDGELAAVRRCLSKLQEQRFTGSEGLSTQDLLQEAKHLFGHILLGALLCLAPSIGAVPVDRDLSLAYRQYLEGERSSQVATRSEAFNEALAHYRKVADQYEDGALYYNLGNTFFQLGEPGWALLSYYRALEWIPRDPRLHENIKLAQEKAGIEGQSAGVQWRQWTLSNDERQLLLSALILLSLLFASVALWFPSRRLLLVREMTIVGTVLVGCLSVYQQYFSGLDGVLIKSASLHRDAGYHYAKVGEQPGLSGMRVEVLDVVEEGHWFRVKMPNGDIGYLPHEAVRLIERRSSW